MMAEIILTCPSQNRKTHQWEDSRIKYAQRHTCTLAAWAFNVR